MIIKKRKKYQSFKIKYTSMLLVLLGYNKRQNSIFQDS